MGSFPNHKGFIKSSAAAEIMTHNYLISGLFVGSDWTSSCDAPGVRTWKTIQLYECNDLKWNLLWDPSELIAVKWSLLWCHDGVSPAFRPELMFSFSSKRIRVQGFFILYHIYLYLYSLYLIRDVSGVLFQPAHTQCFMQRGSEGISWVDWRIGRIYLWFLYPSHAG